MKLTICYFTNRKDPKIEWFFDSLLLQSGGVIDFEVVIVDFYAGERPIQIPEPIRHCTRHVKPKPTVWQGEHRLTSKNYFAAANMRNTAICMCRTEYISFMDDLSVLLPGWLDKAKSSLEPGAYMLGSYMKVKDLVVENGAVKSFSPFPPGVDSRWNAGSDSRDVVAAGSWMFGYVTGPLEGFLRINGFDEDCDSMGGEDYLAGMMLERNGYRFRYSRKMLVYESEEGHYADEPFVRLIKKTPSHDKDSSHAILDHVMGGGRLRAPNYFDGSIRDLRERIIAGEPFPITKTPEHDWRDGQPIREM